MNVKKVLSGLIMLLLGLQNPRKGLKVERIRAIDDASWIKQNPRKGLKAS